MSAPLRSEQFEALLQQLGPDRDAAGARYEGLRRRLLSLFAHRRCPHPEELADQTLDTVARRIQELGSEFDGSDPARYVFGVAWNVARESFRHAALVPLPEKWEKPASPAPTHEDDERAAACLDLCLAQLASSERALVLDYHQGEGSEKIRGRSELARELGLSPNALRLKIHRLTLRLRECVALCAVRTETGLAPGVR